MTEGDFVTCFITSETKCETKFDLRCLQEISLNVLCCRQCQNCCFLHHLLLQMLPLQKTTREAIVTMALGQVRSHSCCCQLCCL